MCGIAGIVNTAGVSPAALERMSNVLRHRGPDDEGFGLLDRDGAFRLYRGPDTVADLPGPSIEEAEQGSVLGLVHRRLSILDLSAAGHQPMTYANGRYLLVFNGEIYNYKELRTELEAVGHEFRSGTDSEVILAAYAAWSETCVERFVGMWAFALVDTAERRLLLSRDRFGIKPLYLTAVRGGFVFASEIKALLAVAPGAARLDTVRGLEYLTFGTLSDPCATLFQGIEELPPANNLSVVYPEGVPVRSRYYDLETARRGAYDGRARDPVAAYENLLSDAVRLHLRSDVPMGSCLSGGLDSSAIIAYAAPHLGGGVLNTFTAAYEDPATDESDYVRAIGRRYGNLKLHFTYPEARSYWEDLGTLLWHQDLPVHSTSMFAQWEVMKLAQHANVKVLLDGQGADEVIGGYAQFGGTFLLDLLKRGRLSALIREARALSTNRDIDVGTELARAGYYALPGGLQRYFRRRRRIGATVIAAPYRAALADVTVPARGGKSFRDQSLASLAFGLHTLLRYEDRNSMAFSIESRVPFLDHRLVEFVLDLPARWKMRDGWSKYIQRCALRDRLPQEVVWRRDKKGFVTPQKAWIDALKGDVLVYVRQANVLPLVDREAVVSLCRTELNNPTHISEFWRVVGFLKWAEVFQVEM